MTSDKIYGMIGLARRAGKTVSGGYATMEAVKSGKAALVIVAADASDRTKKTVSDKCSWRGIPLKEADSGERLGKAMGQEYRSQMAVTDEQMAQAILRLFDENNREKKDI